MTQMLSRIRGHAGFGLMEISLSITLAGVVSTLAIVQFSATRPAIRGDQAARVILSQLHQARALAVSHRQSVRVVFTPPNTIQIVREDTPLVTTTIATEELDGVEYARIAGLPDTPDRLGNTLPASAGRVVSLKFTPEGCLLDQDGLVTSPTIFLAYRNQASSARAITILGTTGRIRFFRWNGGVWSLS